MAEQFNLELDGPRLKKQQDVIRAVMLEAGELGHWYTLEEIARMTGYGPASISAQLRHLRNGTGNYDGPLCDVEKRRRGAPRIGCWEYQVRRKAVAA